MIASAIGTAVGIALAITAVAVWTRPQKRRLRVKREDLDFRTIVECFYAGTDVTMEDVTRAHTRISEATGVPAGALRPDDRFDRELKPRAGWKYDDSIFILSDELARDAASVGLSVNLAEVVSVRDAVHLMKRINDLQRRDSTARSC